MTERWSRWLPWVGRVVALGAMALLGMFDLVFGMPLWQIPTAVATAVIWLPSRAPDSVKAPKNALVVAAGSVFVSAVAFVHNAEETRLWGIAESAGLFMTLYVVARWGAVRWAAPAVVAVGLAVLVQPVRAADGDTAIFVELLFTPGAVAVVSAGGYLRWLTVHRERQVVEARTEQRAEFARDLHDFIAHHVTGIVVQAQGARLIAERDPRRAAAALEQIEQAGAETMSAMRRMVGVLRDASADPQAPLAPLAGAPDIAALVERFAAVGAPAARLCIEGDGRSGPGGGSGPDGRSGSDGGPGLDGLPVEVSLAAYRVVMESLTNVRRHAAGAATVEVAIRRTPEWLLVRVTDDGTARAARDPKGHGLLGLTERVRAVGGWFKAGPGIDGGWVVDAALPLGGDPVRSSGPGGAAR